MPNGIRPTQDKVRKALFDILGDISGLSFLELFAGSGAVGMEAISRYAGEVVFVEKDYLTVKIIDSNLKNLEPKSLSGFPFKANIINKEAQEAVEALSKAKRRFNIVFLDPPYYEGLSKKTLQTLFEYDILAPCGIIIVQHFKRDDLPEALGVLHLFKQAKYGDTRLSFYRKND